MRTPTFLQMTAFAAAITLRAPAAATSPARHGMVASAEVAASRVGVETLKQGGNAVDAAVAVAFALAVVHPDAGNLGGGGFMMLHLASGKNVAIDFRETAPHKATAGMYLDSHGQVIPGASTVGYRSVGIPGTVAGMGLAEERFGKLGWSRVLAPARQLARHGFRVSIAVAQALNDPDTLKSLSLFPESRRLFMPHGRPYRQNDFMTRPDLDLTLARLQQGGPSEFYRGHTAVLIAADMKAHGGLITLQDLRTYRARVRQPVVGTYRGYEVVSMPPPSSGGAALIEMLNILSRYDLRAMGPNTASSVHFMVEAMRRAFADRSRYMGDPDFIRVPTARLISRAWAADRARTILPDRASPSVAPGGSISHEKPETTHFSVVDRWGNAASCTYTLNGPFGSGITTPGTGVVLNDEMDDFTSDPKTPNMFGLIQGSTNAIAPGKRPLSSMTPTIVLRPGSRHPLYLVTGSPGGPTIISTVLQILVNIIDFHMSPADATNSPRFHHQWLPNTIRREPKAFNRAAIARLRAMGYQFSQPNEMGDAQTIEVDPLTGTLLGASDPRGSGAAIGY